ncbi:hypothetical protein T05_11123 [Trichinella murrelli]|uniref:MULE transposase domain-containing protein n=1 Tax=Trichinella murrelli TaxID=144512 RepID=A0A0V0T804_9BILA|nr:hypothetical protein T05_11123 [Trichinella murrelli]
MYHSPTNDILIFATDPWLLAQSNCWCGDGTFNCAEYFLGKLLRVVHSMTIWRDLLAYSRIFEVLHSKVEELGLQLNPAKFVCDFETALIPAI